MSFLDHLDELRRRLIRSMIAITFFFLVSFFFSDKLFNLLAVPVTEALQRSRNAQNVKLAENGTVDDIASVEPGTEIQYTFRAPINLNGVDIPAGTTIAARVEDVPDGRIIVPARPWGIGGKLISIDQPIGLARAAGDSYIGPDDRLVIETVQGAFNLYVKVAFYAAFILAVPYLLYEIWGFVAPGLYPHERKYVWPFVILTSVCFGLGVYFAYEVAFPAACEYLVGLSADEFRPLINADEYFDLIILIMLGLGVVFQIPSVTLFLSRMGLVTAGTLIRFWRYAVVIIFVVAAVLSPTSDVPNLLVFASPMIGLYIISIGIAWFFHKKRMPEEEALEEATGES